MAQIDKPNLHFNTKLYTGNGSSGNAITGVGFQPDWVWIKNRNDSASHNLYDAVRGTSAGKLKSNATAAESYNAQDLSVFGTDGFTVGSNNEVNGSSDNMVSWNWKAANSAGSSNSDGSITSTVSANTTAGFSIVSYTGTNANATVGHGLGVAPKVIILKNRDTTNNWCVAHSSIGFSKHLALNTTDAAASSSVRFQDTNPTSTVYSVGAAGETNGSGNDIIAYCFAEKAGYSKFNSYTGNGNTDGVFVYTGFKPAWIMGKKSAGATNNWYIFDAVRDPFNLTQRKLRPDTNAAEDNNSSKAIDILSNGFKIRNSDSEFNNNGSTYIYMAFAENPIVGSNNIPATAR